MREDKKAISRRNFTKLTAGVLGSIPFMGFPNHFFNTDSIIKGDIHISLFSKHLQFLGYNEMAAASAEIGFNGLDLTVRPKGHVLPEQVEEDLPKAIEAMIKYGLSPRMMTTNVWDITDAEQRKVLETASTLGLSHYRTGWLTYSDDITISESQAVFTKQAQALSEFNKDLNLIGCYQNHAGNHVGAPIWDIPTILSTADTNYLGCQYDIRHAVVEGGNSWELDLRFIEPLIKSIVIKDFKWGVVDGKWQPINTPLGEGMVDFKRYFSLLKKYQINVPMSLHLEYDLGGAEHGAKEIKIDKKEVFARMKKDLNFIRNAWGSVE
ncbi:sugar phosphate isomerase/epimerase family protein [Maribacter hydrothermalis]|uniref:Endonuclease n=1 Tax=Maribacter hydrothermalis TaxID=1836467 RepID=A0A1B7YXS6_9FLAO|nr:TIM barrel protein [Maribacter hydrothermalis]APQ16777.1 endonuclease [Maribacter hydrothermalis]OBR35204.1 endonuclease [Maribacter hydrothermalis]